MKSGVAKHFVFAFALAIGLYAASYSFIEHMRQRKGGWQVTFVSDAAGHPLLIISQPKLNLSNVQLRFPEERIPETNASQTVIFDAPRKIAPFGEIIFIDTTFLPGTVTFDFFGHEVQLLPRVLTVNGREIPWHSDMTIQLPTAEKLPPDRRRRPRRH